MADLRQKGTLFDEEKVLDFGRVAQEKGFSREQIKEFIGKNKRQFRIEPTAQPVPSLLPFLPGAIKDEVVGGTKRLLQNLAQGGRESVSEFALPLVRNTGAILEKRVGELNQLVDPSRTLRGGEAAFGRGGPLKAFNPLIAAQAGSEAAAEVIRPRPEDIVQDPGIADKVIQGVGAAPVTLGTYAVASIATGSPVAGLAAVDALKESDKGPVAALEGGLEGAALGLLLGGGESLKPLAKSALFATIFGGKTALEGGEVSDIVSSGIVGAGLAVLGPRGEIGAREAVRGGVEAARPVLFPKQAKASAEVADLGRSLGRQVATEKAQAAGAIGEAARLGARKVPAGVKIEQVPFRLTPEEAIQRNLKIGGVVGAERVKQIFGTEKGRTPQSAISPRVERAFGIKKEVSIKPEPVKVQPLPPPPETNVEPVAALLPAVVPKKQGWQSFLDPLQNDRGQILRPDIDAAGKRVRDYLQLPDIKTHTYASTIRAVDDWRITRNSGIFAAQQVRDGIQLQVPDTLTRGLMTRAREDASLRGQLSEGDLATAKQIWKMYDDYIPVLKKEGIVSEFQDDYINRIIRETPPGIEDAPTRVGAGKLGTKPSFTRQRARKESGETFTIKELEAFGYELETDISVLASIYKYTAEEAIANKRLVNHIEAAKAPDGTPALKAAKDIPLDQRNDYFEISEASLKKWSGRQLDDKTRILFQEPVVMLHKDVWQTVDGVLTEMRQPGKVGDLVRTARVGIKRGIMFNPLVHGFNVESQVIMELGATYPKRFGFISRLGPEGIIKLQQEMIEGGVELEGLWNIRQRLRSDLLDPNLAPNEPAKFLGVTHKDNPVLWLRDKSDTLLWDKWIKSGQMIVFQDLKTRAMKKGLNREQAIEAAGVITNDLMGTLPKTWYTRKQRRLLFNTLFAPSWTVSNLRTLTGAFGPLSKSQTIPKMLRIEGLSDSQIGFTSSQYRRIIINGVIGVATTGNILQYMFLTTNGQEFHPIWENEEDHKFDIDTGKLDSRGRKIYLKNWLFRQIDDYAKLMQGKPIQFVKAKTDPLIRTGIDIAWNSTFNDKPIIRPGMNRIQQAEALGKYIVKGVTPVDTFVGRDDEVRTWLEALAPFTGTWVRHGLPTGDMNPRVGDIVREFYDYRAKRSLLTDQQKSDVKVLIQENRDIEAFALIDGKTLTERQVRNILLDLRRPLHHRIMTHSTERGWRVKSDFMEFLLTLPEEKRQEYFDALKGALNQPEQGEQNDAVQVRKQFPGVPSNG